MLWDRLITIILKWSLTENSIHITPSAVSNLLVYIIISCQSKTASKHVLGIPYGKNEHSI